MTPAPPRPSAGAGPGEGGRQERGLAMQRLDSYSR